MKNLFILLFLTCTLFVSAQNGEPHLSNIRQLTFGGHNAEASFSNDGKKLCFQSNNPQWDLKCDQIFYMIIEEAEDNKTYKPVMVSNGEGRGTSSCYLQGDKKMTYSSTFITGGKECPPELPKDGRFLWPLFPECDIFVGDEKGKVIKQLTETPGYDAEATVSPKGDKIVFTSTRNGNGDPDLYIMDTDGKNVRQLTNAFGYDGGASFSPDGTRIVFHASRPRGKDSVEYKELLAKNMVAVSSMELFIINIDGTGMKQLTMLGRTNQAPSFHPGGKKIVFSSNHSSITGSDFQVYTINADGTDIECITAESASNAFPVFSPDGKKLVFVSGRNSGEVEETNLFIADWNEEVRIAE
jgi:TolB protein